MNNAINACKDIPAATIARAAGIKLKQNGGREWACCPFHNEKTPSLMFDSVGRFHCFGCGADGDGIDFYGRLYKIDDVKIAAERLAQMFNRSYDPTKKYTPPPQPPERILQAQVEEWFRREWDKACAVKHLANAVMRAEEVKAPTRDSCWDSKAWVMALQALSKAEMMLSRLDSATPEEKFLMMMEADNA